MNNKFIFYPGLDPVDPKNVKTFIREESDESGFNIVFILKEGKSQHWNFTVRYNRDQCFAFLLDQYTSKEKDFILSNTNRYYKEFNHAIIGISLIQLSTNKEPNKPGYGLNIMVEHDSLSYHLLVLEIYNSGQFELEWIDNDCKPYPLNVMPQNRRL